MKINLKKGIAQLADDFVLNTIVSVQELANYDMIYIYHHLHVGASINLEAAGTNVKGDLRFKASYKNFVLGYVTIGGPVKSIYEGVYNLEGKVFNINKDKFLPIKGLDLSIQATKMRMVS